MSRRPLACVRIAGALTALGAAYLLVTLPPVRGGQWRELDPL